MLDGRPGERVGWCRVVAGHRGIAVAVIGVRRDSVAGGGVVVVGNMAAAGCCTVDIADIIMEDSHVAGTG